jgi:SOS response associated peptidase (SRAP)
MSHSSREQIHLRTHHANEPERGDRQVIWRDAVRRSDWHPHYDVAPSQIVETIISVNGEKRLGPMRWGFVSPTAKEPKLAPINARAETLIGSKVDVGFEILTNRVRPAAQMPNLRISSQQSIHLFSLTGEACRACISPRYRAA